VDRCADVLPDAPLASSEKIDVAELLGWCA
jgi:hypothetical protein